MKLLALVLVAAESVLLITLLSGCVTTDVVRFDATNRPPTIEVKVEVLTEKPVRPHKVIARIQIGPDAFVADYQSQTNELIKRAAAMGADAVIVSYGAEGVSKFTAGQAFVYESGTKSGN
jgi:hypothetical protein